MMKFIENDCDKSVAHKALELRYELQKVFKQIDESSLDILISSLTEYNPYLSTDQFYAWVDSLKEKTVFKVKKIPLKQIKRWYFDINGNFRHESGRFFSIEGLKVQTNTGIVKEWKQPIIYQPEIGILGILCQKHDGILYFLLQAKIEPGNINVIQMSPTVQATKSNYSQVHGGKLPPYLDYFINIDNNKIIVDQLQSEQGSRFYKKRNRNIIIEIPPAEAINILENYCWLTLGQIKRLLTQNNIINMDTRSVLACTQIKKTSS